MINEQKLKQALDKLEDTSRKLILILFEEVDGDFNSLFYEYKELRAEILLELAKDFSIPVIADPVLRKQLKGFLKDGDQLIASFKKNEDKGIRGFGNKIEELLKPEFNQKRLDDIEFELFYNKYHPTDYIYRLIETGTIVIKNIDFPEKLKKLILELRECVVLRNYLAAGVMLRTIIDVAVDDIMEKNFPNEEFDHLAEKIGFLKNQPKFSLSCSILSNYLNDLNDFVHGSKVISPDKIEVYVYDIVLDRVQDLYEKSD